jgi:heterodisulfide reductase subunit A
MNAIKQGRQIKEKHPESEIYIFYIDIRAFGRGFEEFYTKSREQGITFIKGKPSEVTETTNGNLLISVEDVFIGKPIEVELDLVVLSIAAVPGKDFNELSKILHIPRGSDGYFLEAHPKLLPVDTHTAGIFLAGACQGPKDIPESVAQGKAAASGVAALLSKGKIRIESIIAHINEDLCIGCSLCEEVCPYGAITVENMKSSVVEALCRGCGVCASICPEKAIYMKHFTDRQVLAQIVTAFQR